MKPLTKIIDDIGDTLEEAHKQLSPYTGRTILGLRTQFSRWRTQDFVIFASIIYSIGIVWSLLEHHWVNVAWMVGFWALLVVFLFVQAILSAVAFQRRVKGK